MGTITSLSPLLYVNVHLAAIHIYQACSLLHAKTHFNKSP